MPVRFPTHLSLNADVILGTTSTMTNPHTIESLLIDITNTINRLDLIVWTRNAIASGAYLASNCMLITAPKRAMYMMAPDSHQCLRRIPEEFDGSDPSQPCLPACVPMVHFVAAVKQLSKDGKQATLVGRQYMGKEHGSVEFEFTGIFESVPRWEHWFFSKVGTLVSGEGVFHRINEEETMEVLMRRCTVLCDAPVSLLTALNITANGPTGKADALLKAHQLLQKQKQQQPQESKEDGEPEDDGNTSNVPSSPCNGKGKNRVGDDTDENASVKASGPTNHAEDAPPASQAAVAPGLLTRKRARNE
ncbi:hypothetical protein OC842_001229 [Tilletia horrida]|uniref:Uncharacterized protein n=1 Tax=Tilletia horrida TaxID=155126 RepID=A0AAN6GHX1_9BASI|nr:hypothetical protein OC842_001229 [Tilletia horrida]KAK0558867.1 hypothetical protein OC844_004825 [Tilletia horrida]